MSIQLFCMRDQALISTTVPSHLVRNTVTASWGTDQLLFCETRLWLRKLFQDRCCSCWILNSKFSDMKNVVNVKTLYVNIIGRFNPKPSPPAFDFRQLEMTLISIHCLKWAARIMSFETDSKVWYFTTYIHLHRLLVQLKTLRCSHILKKSYKKKKTHPNITDSFQLQNSYCDTTRLNITSLFKPCSLTISMLNNPR